MKQLRLHADSPEPPRPKCQKLLDGQSCTCCEGGCACKDGACGAKCGAGSEGTVVEIQL